MYWDTEIDYLAFGMGACDLINDIRIKRPKTIGSYFRYVQNLIDCDQQNLYKDCEVDKLDKIGKIQEIVMCQLRTVKGLQFKKLH